MPPTGTRGTAPLPATGPRAVGTQAPAVPSPRSPQPPDPTSTTAAPENSQAPPDAAELARVAGTAHSIIEEVGTVVSGKRDAVRMTVLVLLAGGHLLVEDIPGVGKTMLAKALAATLGASRRRIQFTPDLLPGDVTGASVYNQSTGDFEFRSGAVFTQILLADEINRASPKTQSALLEAMEERQVSVDGETYPLEEPFMVVATSNPVEMEGTFRLPEAQRDRFLAQMTLGYPIASAEAQMLIDQTGPVPGGGRDVIEHLRAVTDPATVAGHVQVIRRIHAAPRLVDYVVRLARATREHPHVVLGASPRAAVHMVRAAKARAAMDAEPYVRPEHVQSVVRPVWAHRLHLAPAAASRGVSTTQVLDEVLASTAVG